MRSERIFFASVLAAATVFLACVLPILRGAAPQKTAAAVTTAPAAAARPTPLEISERIANYTIRVRLDAEKKLLDASQEVTWHNTQPVAATELRFHLYWNAWKHERTTWMREDRLRSRPRRRTAGPEDTAYCDVKSVKLLGTSGAEIDVTAQLRFDSPDDGNSEDSTVLVVPLPQPVKTGESVKLAFVWTSKIPRTIARTGYRGNFFFIAHWFPQLGVYQPDGTWNCHQFHSATEFFADYGNYDVQITAPSGWLVGATGISLGTTHNADGTSTHRFQQEDVHGFAWTTSPDYREARRRFEHPGLKAVDMRLLYQPEHESQVERHFRATEAALRYYGEWFGAYPYGHVTVIDPAYGAGAGGMEYPTLFTCGTRFWNPAGGGSPEGVTVHEAGHQFWYGLVGNNEIEHAWLDEGLNTYSETRTMFEAYGPPVYVERLFKGFFPVALHGIRVDKLTDLGLNRYRDHARRDTQATPTYLYYPDSASSITYSKTGLWLETMERMYGWETTRKILSTFFERWKFHHPKPQDFFAIANETSGQDMTPFFVEVHYKAAVFDYAVEMADSREIKPPAGPASAQQTLYESRVLARRLGDGVLPVEVLLRFENGEEIRDIWDGQDLWRLYVFVRPVKLDFAVVDPDRKLALDVNYTNNSRRVTAHDSLPATKWAGKWMVWLQDLLMTMSFLN